MGVQHLMYTTHVATGNIDNDKINIGTLKDDYRSLLLHLDREYLNLKNFGTSINVNGMRPYPRDGDEKNTANCLVNQVMSGSAIRFH